ncbi:hypothetical protein [Streptomyces endophytica]|uniref:Uncharacterized protein n=1 Tax=Streptomyces endophytica TaxID=2991496 RepID=A0ABY6PBG7_9ACTN|nr:hypothetical protein [Streptomyces endophytica]UZJ31116.1 hypothetical protein OJ254_13145 [Streptomyces endophytica]
MSPRPAAPRPRRPPTARTPAAGSAARSSRRPRCAGRGDRRAAPPAPAAPTGCGDLVRGQLCLRGPVGSDGTYTATYRRHGAAAGLGKIPVRLGYQRKNTRITAFPAGSAPGGPGTARSR